MAEQQQPYVEFKHVSKAFGSHVVLDDVSFDVLPGETVCILGRSGVGKSVSLHCIMGFLKPDAGRVVVAYEDRSEEHTSELQSQSNLVCRLLLEKKKNRHTQGTYAKK